MNLSMVMGCNYGVGWILGHHKLIIKLSQSCLAMTQETEATRCILVTKLLSDQQGGQKQCLSNLHQVSLSNRFLLSNNF